MARLKVKVGNCYCYDPVLYDIADPPPGRPKKGDILCVVRLPHAPPPGTMGMVHVVDRSGKLMGLVFQNSLRPYLAKDGCQGSLGGRR